MAEQLVLLHPGDRGEPGDVDWRLDEHTREVGRQGLAAARQALAEAARSVPGRRPGRRAA